MRIIIVGGGLIGLACAWRLRSAGHQVTVLDAAPQARAASWAAGGMLAPHHEALNHPEHHDHDLWRLGCRSLARWRDFAAELGGSALIDHREGGGVVPLRSPAVDAAAGRLAKAGVAVRVLTAAELAEREPALAEVPSGGWWLPGGQVDPRRCLERLTALGADRGVTMRQAAVRGLHPGRVLLADGTSLESDQVVLASGAWTPALAALAGIGLPGEPVKGQMLRFAVPDGLLAHFVHAPGTYLIPRAGQGVVVGATMEQAGFDQHDDPDAVARLAAGARALAPALAGAAVAECWTGLRPRLLHGRPVLARLVPGLVLATGHFRNGILLAPATADAVLGLVEGRGDALVDCFAMPAEPDVAPVRIMG